MLSSSTKTKMANTHTEKYKDLKRFIKVSGFSGGLDQFADTFLSTNNYGLLYQFKKDGNFNDAQKQMIIDQLKEGKNRDYGIKDVSLNLLEKILGREIPRAGDINIEGDNIAVNNSSVSVKKVKKSKGSFERENKILKNRVDELEKENMIIKAQNDMLMKLLNERKGEG